MKPNNVLVNAVLAAVAAAVTAAGTSYLFLHYAPMGSQSANPERIERIIRDHLVNKPEILVEMTNELDKRQAAEQSVHQQKAISQNADVIFRSPVSPVAGNPNGDVSVVEFFDYNCPYCHRALPEVLKLINEDGKVRLVLKELPILSHDSMAAAKKVFEARRLAPVDKIFAQIGKGHGESWEPFRRSASAPAG
jgi:protein-disulfide isomerase